MTALTVLMSLVFSPTPSPFTGPCVEGGEVDDFLQEKIRAVKIML